MVLHKNKTQAHKAKMVDDLTLMADRFIHKFALNA
jgi:hypothetical protein